MGWEAWKLNLQAVIKSAASAASWKGLGSAQATAGQVDGRARAAPQAVGEAALAADCEAAQAADLIAARKLSSQTPELSAWKPYFWPRQRPPQKNR